MLQRKPKQGQKNWQKATSVELGKELAIGTIPLRVLLDEYTDSVRQPRKKGSKGPGRIYFIPKKSWTNSDWSVKLAHSMRERTIKNSKRYNPNVTGNRVHSAHSNHASTVIKKKVSTKPSGTSQSELERRLNLAERHIAELLMFKHSCVSDIKELKTYAQNDNRQINLINKAIKDMTFEVNLLDDAFKSYDNRSSSKFPATDSAIKDMQVDINFLRHSVDSLKQRNKRNFISRLLSRWTRKLGDIWHVIKE
jgi:hypothetical protein